VPQSTALDEVGLTHYVLVIHGTWNRPERGVTKWYQLDKNSPDNFCGRLNELVRPVFGDAVWRRCRGTPLRFSWRGENTDDGRVTAARRLCALLIQIGQRDPSAVIHLVAHSHGGNVVLHAIQLYFEDITRKLDPYAHVLTSGIYEEHFRSRNRIGRLVFLGTPFLRKSWIKPPRIPAALSQAIVGFLVALCVAVFFPLFLVPYFLTGVPAKAIRAISSRTSRTVEPGKPARSPAFLKFLSAYSAPSFVWFGLFCLLLSAPSRGDLSRLTFNSRMRCQQRLICIFKRNNMTSCQGRRFSTLLWFMPA
jgi:pimeloyl-ACP methyl ester carboxylesterase